MQTFYLSNASQQNDLNDVSTALRNVLTNAKIYGVPSQNAIVMRATPDELLLAQKLVNDLDKARPEVVVDVAVLEVNKNLMRQIGIQLPQTASVTITTPTTATSTSTTTTTTTGSTTTNNLTLNNIAHLNANDFAVTIGQAQANLLLSDSDTKVLENPRLRASDGQQATLKIGSRIPIATGSFSNGVGGSALGGIGAVQTQFQYIDVGVNIDMKPTIHFNRDVTLKLKIEISSESGSTTISGVTEPIISQRTVDQVIRLKEGEVNLLGGLLDDEKDKSISGWPGLGEIPFLKYLFSTISTTKIDDEIVFLLIPHVVRAPELTPLNLETIDTGTTSGFEIRRKPAALDGTAPQASVVPASAVPPSNAVASNAGSGGVTGQTAAVAAGNALNAMHQRGQYQSRTSGSAATGRSVRAAEGRQQLRGLDQSERRARYLLGADADPVRPEQAHADQRGCGELSGRRRRPGCGARPPRRRQRWRGHLRLAASGSCRSQRKWPGLRHDLPGQGARRCDDRHLPGPGRRTARNSRSP